MIDTDSVPGAIYVGDVVHKRARPKRHSLRYRVFSMLVDLDRLDCLDEKLRFFSLNRFNLVSLVTSDFGARDGSSIAAFIHRQAAAAGVGNIARIRMLAYPRLLGFAFNPITVYYCEDAAGVVRFMAYEVSNTFGEHHFYQAGVTPVDGEIRHEADKALYVSPFNTMEGRYRFSVRPPAENVFLGVTLSDEEGGLLTAYFEGEERALTDATLLKLLLAYPFMTAKVVAGIHWEALLLWLKGVPPTLKLRRPVKRREQI
ncbi:MAG: DUF1365 domain-containing protein [Candidatus Devosia phytovorans]|uniref:DUF1365 domain-containing protein n=1 Tax=Candidatus Devosia phytovorans TaxID=3121372 RepID=A0AAJ6B247_9HYPH|nr:DUF1365 domain-containing protein [Devosia sp.]WEK06411.1 MAG: DUF1365 domain-containing protein [Devosia sp.]